MSDEQPLEHYEANTRRAYTLLLNLDRCEHGRHSIDYCWNCGSTSVGNPHIQTGQLLGYDYKGDYIIVPEIDLRQDIKNWFVEREI